MAFRVIRGRVVQIASTAFEEVVVEAWTEHAALMGRLGLGAVSESGDFRIALADARVARLARHREVAVFFKVYRGESLVAVTRAAAFSAVSATPVEIDVAAHPASPELVVRGTVHAEDGAPLVGVVVRAFDRDMRREQTLGEATTDGEGCYCIAYDRQRFTRAEKTGPDLVVRAYDKRDRPLVATDVMFDAPADAVVRVMVGWGRVGARSLYEQLVDDLEPLLDGVALEDLTDDDVRFLVRESGTPRSDVEALRISAKWASETQIPAVAFFALARRTPDDDDPFGASLSAILALGEAAWRARLTGAVEGEIIPRALRLRLDEILCALRDLRSVGHDDHAVALARVAHLSLAALRSVRRHDEMLARLRDAWVERMRATLDTLDPPATVARALAAVDLGSIFAVTDDVAGAIQALIAQASLSDATRGAVRSWLADNAVHLPSLPRIDLPLHDAIPALRHVLNRGDLVGLVQAAGLDLEGAPSRVSELASVRQLDDARLVSLREEGGMDGAAVGRLGLLATLRGVLPLSSAIATSKALEARQIGSIDAAVRAPALLREAVLESHETPEAAAGAAEVLVRALSSAFPTVAMLTAHAGRARVPDAAALSAFRAVGARGREALRSDVAFAALNDDEREAVAPVRAIVGLHPGLGLEALLDSDDETASNALDERVTAFRTVAEEVGDLTDADLSKERLERDFPNVRDVEAVAATLRAYARALRTTSDAEHAVRLISVGGQTGPRTAQTTAKMLDVDADTAAQLHDARVWMGTQGRQPLWYALDLWSDNAWIARLTNDAGARLREPLGFEDLFTQSVTCDCEHCKSVLGPIAYFADLLHLVETRVLARSFASTSHPLHLRSRRPDLFELPLTCESTDRDVAYLEIVRPVLARYIVGNGQAETVTDADDVVVDRAFRTLSTSVSSFAQPFSRPHHAAAIALEQLSMSLPTLAALLDGPARLELSLTQARADVITSGLASADASRRPALLARLEAVFDLVDDAGLPRPIPSAGTFGAVPIDQLLRATDLSRTAFLDACHTAFVRRGGLVRVRTLRDTSGLQAASEVIDGLSADLLDRLHRFVRLLRHTPYTIGELDLLLEAAATDDLGAALEGVSAIRRVERRLGLTPEAATTLLGAFPARAAAPDAPTLGEKLFGRVEVGDSSAPMLPSDVFYIHPAHADAATPSNMHARLLAGLSLDDAGLRASIEALAGPLGVDLSSSVESARGFTLNGANLGLLHRHAQVARALGVSIPELFDALALLGYGGVVDGPATALSLADDLDWLRESGLGLEELRMLVTDGANDADRDAAARAQRAWSEEGRVSFADTVFATVAGVTEARSRQIVSDNASRFVALGAGLYRLTDDDDLSLPLSVPGLEPVEPMLRERLAPHRAAVALPPLLGELVGATSAQISAWLAWCGIAPADLVPALRGESAIDPLVHAFAMSRRVARAVRGLDGDEVGVLDVHPEAFGPAPITHIAPRTLRNLATYRRLHRRLDTAGWSSLLGSYGAGRFAASAVGSLAPVVLTDTTAAAELADAWPSAADRTAMEALDRLTAASNIVQTLGIGARNVAALLRDDYDPLEAAANALFAQLEDDASEAREALSVRERDALADHILFAMRPRGTIARFEQRSELHAFFLLDTEVAGCMRTTPVAAAISSVQLYIQRVRMGLEQGAGDEGIVVQTDLTDAEWEWRKSYRLWELNRRIFLHAECHLHAFRRDDRTPLFEVLEDELLQAKNLDEQAVVDAYSNYLKGLEELAHLTLAGAFQDELGDTVYLFGATSHEPPTYYMRTITGMRAASRNDGRGVRWGHWARVDVQIPVRRVSPALVGGRLVLFWTTIATRAESSIVEGSSRFDGYQHTLSVHYAVRRPNGSWTSPQRLSLLSEDGFGHGDGVLFEPAPADAEPEEGHVPPNPLLARVYTSTATRPFSPWLSDLRRPAGVNVTLSTTLERLATARWTPGVSPFGPPDFGTGQAPGWPPPSVLERSVDLDQQAFGDKVATPHYPVHRLLLRMTAGAARSADGLDVLRGQIVFGMTRPLVDPYDWHFATAATLIDPARPLKIGTGTAPDITPASVLFACSAGSDVRVEPAERLLHLVEVDGASFLLLQLAWEEPDCTLHRVGSSVVSELRQRLMTGGLDAMLAPDTQRLAEPDLPFGISDRVHAHTDQTLSDRNGSMAIYFRELFLHIPMLIAAHATGQGRYESAMRWLARVFDPTDRTDDGPFLYQGFPRDEATLLEELRDPAALAAYQEDPFNPHAIARARPIAYAKAAFLQYVKNLIEWGDSLFARFTRESVNEAVQVYLFAQSLLGVHPRSRPACDPASTDDEPWTYERLGPLLEDDSEVLVTSEQWVFTQRASTRSKKKKSPKYAIVSGAAASNDATDGTTFVATAKLDWTVAQLGGVGRSAKELGWRRNHPAWDLPEWSISRQVDTIFCIPPCKEPDRLRDVVADRLFKIRHCQNIDGEVASFAPFAPPIDPDLAGALRRAGLSLDDVVSLGSGRVPPYRFLFLVERAKGHAQALSGIGAALLSAIEKRDGEELSRLRLVHQKNLADLTDQIRQDDIDAAEEAISIIERRKEAATYRREYNQGLVDEFLSPGEIAQQVLQHQALQFRIQSAGLSMASAIAHLVPQVGSPFTLEYGGQEIGDSLGRFGTAVGQMGGIIETLASFTGTAAGYARRAQAWQHVQELTDHELRQIEHELLAARLRKRVAERSQRLHEEGKTQLEEVQSHSDEKLAGLGLYTFYATELTRLYRNAFEGALSTARLAERALHYERGEDAPRLRGDYWDAVRAGMLAGERLHADLSRLERWFIETHDRKMEVDQTFPLSQIDPDQLWALKRTGECIVDLPELYFDLAYPGQFRRQVRALRVTIPAITGPYVNVSATLEMLSGSRRDTPDAPLTDVPLERRSLIATSTAQNDAGVFELSFADARYLPFEGQPAIGRYRLRLPAAVRSFDYETIDDVLIHVAYTAEHDDALRTRVETALAELSTYLRDASRDLWRVVSFRRELGGVLSRVSRAAPDIAIPFEIGRSHFPFFLRGFDLGLRAVSLAVRLAPRPGETLADLSGLLVRVRIDDVDIGGFAVDAATGLAESDTAGRDALRAALGAGLFGEHRIAVSIDGAPAGDRLADVLLALSVDPRRATP